MSVLQQYRRKVVLLGEDNNALVWLIIINAIIFAMLAFTRLIYVMSYDKDTVAMQLFHRQIFDWFTLPASATKLLTRPWTLLTYMFTHESVMMLISNVLWLWCFGYILQDLSGNNKLIPLYLYGGVIGGIAFLFAINFLPSYNSSLIQTLSFEGASASVMAVAIATTTVAPTYKIFPMINGGIPLWVLTIIFVAVVYLGVGNDAPLALSYLFAGSIGFFYVKQLNKGNDLGKWMYDFASWLNNLFNPEKNNNAPAQQNFYKTTRKPYNKIAHFSQQKLDDILDKIHANGYQSLTEDEKEFLKKASQENL